MSDTWSDYWWHQRYDDDAMFEEHQNGHPNSDQRFCVDCIEADEELG
jgi:hypothetical protein